MQTVFQGRMGRKNFIIGLIVWFVYYYVVTMLSFYLGGWKLAFDQAVPIHVYLLMFISWFPLFVILAKRLQDLNKSGYYGLVFLFITPLLFIVMDVLPEGRNISYYILLRVIHVCSQYLIVIVGGVLLLLNSRPVGSQNRFGIPDTGRTFWDSLFNS